MSFFCLLSFPDAFLGSGSLCLDPLLRVAGFESSLLCPGVDPFLGSVGVETFLGSAGAGSLCFDPCLFFCSAG